MNANLGIQIRMKQDPDYQKLVLEGFNKMCSGFWPQDYMDSIFQKFERFKYDIYDAALFIEIHTAIQSGQILRAIIDLGKEPAADKMIEENKAAIKSLFPPFYGSVWCGTADCDGELGWKSNIKCAQLIKGVEIFKLIQPRTVPLEIGYTEAYTSWNHLGREAGLARWPYGSKEIHLFITADQEFLFGNRICKAMKKTETATDRNPKRNA